jgi:hypothetical protein
MSLSVFVEAIMSGKKRQDLLPTFAGAPQNWEISVTDGGDIALSFVAGGLVPSQSCGQQQQRSRILCDKEAAMAISRDLLRAVALADAQDKAAGRPNRTVFSISQPDVVC